MWIFKQVDGQLIEDGALVATGWAGQLAGRNNPAMQNVPNIGPLPVGFYTIEPSYHHPHLGPVTMNLDPHPTNEMFGRADFRMHGASADHPELSSHGCIIMPRDVRVKIANSSDRMLQVLSGI
jgi:hypothetical protein